jgi:hypothetical protein
LSLSFRKDTGAVLKSFRKSRTAETALEAIGTVVLILSSPSLSFIVILDFKFSFFARVVQLPPALTIPCLLIGSLHSEN